MASAEEQRTPTGRPMPLFSNGLRPSYARSVFDAARVDGGFVPCLGLVRLWRIFEKEAGRSAQAYAANPGATLAVTSCTVSGLPLPNHNCLRLSVVRLLEA